MNTTRVRADAKAVQTVVAPDFSKCAAKFPSMFNDLEANAGMDICPTEGDAASIDAREATKEGGDENTKADDCDPQRLLCSLPRPLLVGLGRVSITGNAQP